VSACPTVVIVVVKTVVSSRAKQRYLRFLVPGDPALSVEVSTAAKPSRSEVDDALH